jgi:hypothetical protein
VPARVEAHEAGIAVQVERSRLAARRQEAQHYVDPDAEPLEPRPDREGGALGALGLDWTARSNTCITIQ